MGLHGGQDGVVVGGDDHTARLRPGGLLGSAHHHRLAADVEQGLAGQARGGGPSRDDGDEAHAGLAEFWALPEGVAVRSRASASSMTGMPSRMGKASLSDRKSTPLNSSH